jgi:hypothetical protein
MTRLHELRLRRLAHRWLAAQEGQHEVQVRGTSRGLGPVHDMRVVYGSLATEEHAASTTFRAWLCSQGPCR